jgi:ATP-dependent Clp protease ATP-binding subunit ClpA
MDSSIGSWRRKDVEERYRLLEPVFSTSVEIPFNADAQRALHFAAEEADRLLHNYVGNEHLLLGLLRAHGSVAESILAKHGLRLEDVRTAIREVLHESPRRSSAAIDGGLSGEIDSIKGMVRQLAGRSSDSEEAATLRELIVRSLDALKRHLAGGHEDDR